jgi:hypothetical protein
MPCEKWYRYRARGGADAVEYFVCWIVILSMNTVPSPATATYASGYNNGRHAAKEHVAAADNPFHAGSPAFHGWNDGHYDERSARRAEIERHNAAMWSKAQA